MTKDDLTHAAIVSGIVDESAVHDAESYDSGATLAKLDAMYEALQPEPEQKILSWLKANARKGRSTVSINVAPNGDITLDNLHAESAGGCIHCGGEHE